MPFDQPEALSESQTVVLQRTTSGALRQALAAVVGVGLLTAAARIVIPLTPVPISFQTFAVLLVGALYGSRLGASTVFAYLLCGLAGMPVFAGGAAGPGVFFGPTAGYLVGFVLAAYAMGGFQEVGRGRLLFTFAGVATATLFIYLCGIAWLAAFVGGDMKRALAAGVLPFIAPDAIKALLAVALTQPLRKPVQRWLRPTLRQHTHDANP